MPATDAHEQPNADTTGQERSPISYFESAFVIAGITAVGYILGWAYTDGYLSRLGIHHRSIEFPTSYYILESLPGIMAAIFLYFLSYGKAFASVNPKVRPFLRNAYYPITALLMVYYTFQQLAGWLFYLILGSSVLLTIVYVVNSLSRRETDALGVLPKSIAGKLTALAGLVVGGVLVSGLVGDFQAGKTVEGSLHNTIRIQLKTKQPISQLESAKTLILILHHDNNYYITKQESPAPKFPDVYIIPDDQVEFVTLTKLTGTW